MTTTRANRPDWAAGQLYTFISRIFPKYRTAGGIFDVQRLRTELGCSHECVYQWFRKGRLTPKNARALHKLAKRTANVSALKDLNRAPPRIEDFNRFVYAA